MARVRGFFVPASQGYRTRTLPEQFSTSRRRTPHVIGRNPPLPAPVIGRSMVRPSPLAGVGCKGPSHTLGARKCSRGYTFARFCGNRTQPHGSPHTNPTFVYHICHSKTPSRFRVTPHPTEPYSDLYHVPPIFSNIADVYHGRIERICPAHGTTSRNPRGPRDLRVPGSPFSPGFGGTASFGQPNLDSASRTRV